MARGGYFEGNDYVPYKSGPLSKSSSTSSKEIEKKNTIKCPNCGRVVPLKRVCIFCDYVFIK
jgi:hypothetical protein